MKVGQTITQDDINKKIFQDLEKLENKMSWTITLQASLAVATIIIMLNIAGATIK